MENLDGCPPERVENNAFSHLLAKERLANETTGNGCFSVDSPGSLEMRALWSAPGGKMGNAPSPAEEEPAYLPAAYSR
jgi:hypothetical protein